MKTIYFIAITLMMVSCGPSDQVTLSKENYLKLIGDTIKPEYPKTVNLPYFDKWTTTTIIIQLGSDGHEYQLHRESEVNNQWTHYGGCKKCQKEKDDMNHKLDHILETINNKPQ